MNAASCVCSAGVPRPPLSVFQDAPIEENKQNREVELQHFNPLSLDRESSSSSASTDSFRTAYAQSFASAHSMDDITTPRSLGSARSRNASAASTPSKTPGKRPNMMVGGAPGRPEHLVNGHDPAYSMEQNRAGKHAQQLLNLFSAQLLGCTIQNKILPIGSETRYIKVPPYEYL